MQLNIFQPWTWFIAAAVCYLTLPLVVAQAAIGPSTPRPEDAKGSSAQSTARSETPRWTPADLQSRAKASPLDALKRTAGADAVPRPRMTALYGDPAKTGPFAVRFQFPNGYQVPINTHLSDRYITLISGKVRMAPDDGWHASTTQPLVAGAFMRLAADVRHRLWADADSIVQLHSSGPFDVELAA
jgi:hypothetical protein